MCLAAFLSCFFLLLYMLGDSMGKEGGGSRKWTLEQFVFVWMLLPQDFALEHLHCSTDPWVGASHLREAAVSANPGLSAACDVHDASFACGCDE